MQTLGRFSTVLRVSFGLYFTLCLHSCETVRTPPSPPHAPGTIGGRVINELGKPVESAQLYFRKASEVHSDRLRTVVETDVMGRWQYFTSRQIPPGLAIVVQYSEYAPTIFNASPQLHTELVSHTAELKIKKGFKVSGKILDQSGKPVNGATLGVYVPFSEAEQAHCWPIIVKSHTDGTFYLRLPSEKTYKVFLIASGYRDQTLEAPFTAHASPITFTLTPYEQLRGRIVDESGHPIENAEIEIHPSDEELWNSLEVSAGPDGWCAQFVFGETWVRKSGADGTFAWNNWKTRAMTLR